MEKKFNFWGAFLIVILTFSLFSLLGSNNFSNLNKVSKSVSAELMFKSIDDKILIWVEFTDKGSKERVNQLTSNPGVYLTQESIDRRKKVKPLHALIDFTDIPLNSEYVNAIKNSGIEIKNSSKWFNRISCFAGKMQIEELIDFNFVNKIDLVRTFSKNPGDIELTGNPEFTHDMGIQNSVSYLLSYGNSLTQMEMINAPIAHDSGYKGQGVLIASFDAGFDNLSHPVFDSIRARGFRTYDFVNHDTIVADQEGQMGLGWHGTMTLSLIGGYKPGSLISPAFRSRYLLAKTENTDSETPLEEDNWIAAAEWADSLGADIITSSLGYLGMDGGSSHSYDWTWMNGDSCFITMGADLAVNKGIIVCNSAGNEGFHATRNTLVSPSDGDSVICVGSVNSPSKNRSSFSSVGLSIDGRIKPDVCAMGSGNYIAATGEGNTGYSSGSGTSFSCPMTAGACAVILSANPNLTPRQMWQVLIQTADSSFAPNRRRGWGLINTWEALKLAKSKTLNLTLLIEGFYDSGADVMVSDTLIVYLRNGIPPFNVVDSAKGYLNASGAASFEFNNAIGTTGYYLQTSHRNGLETWSKAAQTFDITNNLTYNFTSDSAKAYGNNLKKKGARWTIYNGDILKNGVVELDDLLEVHNAVAAFGTGYINTDVTGDNSADLNDLLLVYNNSAEFVSLKRP